MGFQSWFIFASVSRQKSGTLEGNTQGRFFRAVFDDLLVKKIENLEFFFWDSIRCYIDFAMDSR